MTTYTIETGIPLPAPRRNPGSVRRPLTPWTVTLDKLEPGQSTLTGEREKMMAASQFRQRRPEKAFAIRKVPGEGWRVWRTA